MRFIADSMLGTLARWLRALGFDTVYARNMDDEDILSMANAESRIVISRDRELCGRARGSILLRETELEAQILAVIDKHAPDRGRVLSRCLECNGVIAPFDRKKVGGRVPPSVMERHSEFMECPDCRRVFWKGTHYRNMLERIDELLAQCEP